MSRVLPVTDEIILFPEETKQESIKKYNLVHQQSVLHFRKIDEFVCVCGGGGESCTSAHFNVYVFEHKQEHVFVFFRNVVIHVQGCLYVFVFCLFYAHMLIVTLQLESCA